MPLISVNNDINSDGGGGLQPPDRHVYINNLKVVVQGDPAVPDSLCPDDSIHCAPNASTGSPNVFVGNIAVHRQNDSRTCGAKTIVVGQTTVFAN